MVDYMPVDQPVIDSLASNKIIVWGHSAGRIIEPFLDQCIKEMIGDGYVFERCSVNGETMLQIAARQGSLPALFKGSFCHKSDDGFIIADGSHPLVSSFDGSSVTFSIVNGVNPCMINGVKGYLSENQNAYVFYPDNDEPLVLDDFNIINTSASSSFRYPLLSVFWCDQPEDRNNVDSLLKKYIKMVRYAGNDRFLIVGSIRGDKKSHQEVESLLASEFKSQYFNARAYLVSEAGKNPSAFSKSDQKKIKSGSVPSAWMKDDVHLNSEGAAIVAGEVARIAVSHGFIQRSR